MKEQIAIFFKEFSALWNKMGKTKKTTLILIVMIALIGVVFIGASNSTAFMTPLFTARISDKALVNRISLRLDREGVSHTITQDGMIYVKNKDEAKKMINILSREDLVPQNASPWSVFKMDKWSTTDFERNVNFRHAAASDLERHIESLDDVDRARVTLVLPEKELFSADSKKVSASIIITPRYGSDISVNRKKVEAVIKLVKDAVEGLEDDNITITDVSGNVLSDFSSMPVLPPPVLPQTTIENIEIGENTEDAKNIYGVSYEIVYIGAFGFLLFAAVIVFILRKAGKNKKSLLEEARIIASENPEEVARLIKTWLAEEEGR